MDENINIQATESETQPVETVPAATEAPAGDGGTPFANTTTETGLPNQPAIESASAPTGGNSFLWIAIAAVAALVVIGTVIGLVLRKKSKSSQQENLSETLPLNTEMNGEAAAPAITGSYEVGYAQTIGARENQEDSFGVAYPKPLPGQNEKLMAVVCDGMGGLDDGQIASATAVKVLTGGFEDEMRIGTPQSCLLNLCARAQNAVVTHNHKTGSNTGCTLVSIVIREGRMSFISVGDSRISLYRSGALLQLNRDHVLGQEMDERQAFTGNGLNDPVRRRAITSHIGKETFSKVDRNVNPIQLMHGDKILLMSDGLFGALTEDEILRELAYPAQQAANRLVQAVTAKALPGQDNATIVIVSYP